ncbi:MAG: phosphatidate cytidylyltransferase [Holosporaceae bacterium]|jgi:phosphatidate cytidylyltransferase|nr:phosphatidate cytidylyltransferase [Holosporaceae bacterium]
MESSVIKERIDAEKKEFVYRLFSSFLFILIVFLLFWVPYKVFSFLCWGTYALMLYEIFSPKINGKIPLRMLSAFICFVGIHSFTYCREFLGQPGCVFLICVASFTDIGAYSFGKILRGPKLCPKISPNKTWAGFWGGILFTNVAIFCLNNTFFSVEGKFLHLMDFWTIQVIILASVAGDLLESWFKRLIGVKDMGDLFPGHGGILDRLDSLLLASIVLAIVDILF